MIPLIPTALSVAGSFLPGIISALAGSKTKEQARAAVAPIYDGMVAQMVGRGMRRDEAMAKADEDIQQAVAEKMQEGALPGWAEALLGVAGGIGGWAAGAKIAAKRLAKAGAATAAAPPAPGTNLGKLGLGGEPKPGLKLERGILRPFSPTASQRGIGAKSDGLADQFDAKPRPPRTMEMESRRTPGRSDQGMDDGSDAIMQSMPERGLAAPFRKFQADIEPPSSGRAPRPERPLREVEPISVRNTEDEILMLGMEPRIPRGSAERQAIDAIMRERRLEEALRSPFPLTPMRGVDIEG